MLKVTWQPPSGISEEVTTMRILDESLEKTCVNASRGIFAGVDIDHYAVIFNDGTEETRMKVEAWDPETGPSYYYTVVIGAGEPCKIFNNSGVNFVLIPADYLAITIDDQEEVYIVDTVGRYGYKLSPAEAGSYEKPVFEPPVFRASD